MTFKFPPKTTEDWRFTDLTLLNSLGFNHAKMVPVSGQSASLIREHFIDDTIRIVMINGFYIKELSDLQLEQSNLEIVDSNFHQDGNDLQQLNITIKNGVETPVHFLNVAISETQNIIANVQVNFILLNNVNAKLIEEHISLGMAQSLCSNKMLINLNSAANLQHTFVQAMAKTSFSLSEMTVNLAKNSVYNINLVVNGARLSRYDLNINLNENHAEANIHGLCLINGRQIAGLKTRVCHNASNSRSNHIHKSIVDNGAHSIFNGTIYVALNASQTESHQQNRSLMLSKKSRITTEPKLEINNDDVVCTHGATISQMDEDIMFFLKARGICEIDAKKLCIEAFANEVMSKIEYRDILKNIHL